MMEKVFLLPDHHESLSHRKGPAMTTQTKGAVRRALASIRRTYADLDRASRAMVEYEPTRTR